MVPSYLFLSDVDGTLLRRDVAMSPELLAAAAAYRNAGGLLALCTGRSILSSQAVAHQLGVNAPCILLGGASIYDFHRQKHLFLQTFYDGILDAVEDVLRYHPSVSMQVFSPDAVYTLRRTIRLNQHGVIEENQGPEHSLSAICKPVVKLVMCCDDPGELAQCKKYFPASECDFAFSSRTFADVVPLGCNKVDTARRLLSLLKIPQQNLFAAGDAMTDLPLLRLAAHSFAPQNAMDTVKSCVSYVVPSVLNGGMSQAFYKACSLLPTITP